MSNYGRQKTWQHYDPHGVSPVWLVIGSGPSAPEGVRAALDEFHPQLTITTNAGYRLFGGEYPMDYPKFYFLSDAFACEVYNDRSSLLQVKGTLVLTPERVPSAIKARKMEHADQFIRSRPDLKPGRYHPGEHAAQPLSGLWILDIALNRGAKTVLIVGYDGYRSFGDERCVDYFDGRRGHGRSRSHNEIMAGYLASAVDTRPNVRFVMFGDPVYDVPEAANFRLVRVGGEVAA